MQNYVYGKQEVLDPAQAEVRATLEECNLYTELDPEQMQRILDNLIENSIKYSEQEPVEVEISLREQEDRLLLTVSDNGVGVPGRKTSAYL